jgi:hypothetical protein
MVQTFQGGVEQGALLGVGKEAGKIRQIFRNSSVVVRGRTTVPDKGGCAGAVEAEGVRTAGLRRVITGVRPVPVPILPILVLVLALVPIARDMTETVEWRLTASFVYLYLTPTFFLPSDKVRTRRRK